MTPERVRTPGEQMILDGIELRISEADSFDVGPVIVTKAVAFCEYIDEAGEVCAGWFLVDIDRWQALGLVEDFRLASVTDHVMRAINGEL